MDVFVMGRSPSASRDQSFRIRIRWWLGDASEEPSKMPRGHHALQNTHTHTLWQFWTFVKYLPHFLNSRGFNLPEEKAMWSIKRTPLPPLPPGLHTHLAANTSAGVKTKFPLLPHLVAKSLPCHLIWWSSFRHAFAGQPSCFCISLEFARAGGTSGGQKRSFNIQFDLNSWF